MVSRRTFPCDAGAPAYAVEPYDLMMRSSALGDLVVRSGPGGDGGQKVRSTTAAKMVVTVSSSNLPDASLGDYRSRTCRNRSRFRPSTVSVPRNRASGGMLAGMCTHLPTVPDGPPVRLPRRTEGSAGGRIRLGSRSRLRYISFNCR